VQNLIGNPATTRLQLIHFPSAPGFDEGHLDRQDFTSNGVSRLVTKLEAAVTQLLNQAASGDPRAIRELLYLHRLCEEPAEAVRAETGPQEVDKLVMESIRKRILQSEELSSAKGTDPKAPKSSEEVH